MRIEQEPPGCPKNEAARKAEEDPQGAPTRPSDRARGRRPVRARHRAAREPADRQPAARPLRPAGRPGCLAVLPVAGRRPDADLRLRAHGQHAGQAGPEEGEAIVHRWVNKALEKAQSKVEGRNFEIRKNLLKFDDVMNDQRKVIYEQRRELMQAEDVQETVTEMRHQTIEDLVSKYVPEQAYPEQWDWTPWPRSAGGCSRSTCRSRTGRRKRASPTRKSWSGSSASPTSTWRKRPPTTARN